LFFFASPKKNQKRSPEKDYIPFSGSSYVGLLYYCSFNICNSTLRIASYFLTTAKLTREFTVTKSAFVLTGV